MFNQGTLRYELKEYKVHMDSVDVLYYHTDLPKAKFLSLHRCPRKDDGSYLDGENLDLWFIKYAPDRAWFEAEERRLTNEQLANLPIEYRKTAPLKDETGGKLEWFEGSETLDAEFIDGAWYRPIRKFDKRERFTIDVMKELLTEELANVRFNHETSGLMIEGMLVKTDRESQSTVVGAYARALQSADTKVQWKAANGFIELNAQQIIAFGGKVFDFVQGCFAREQEIAALIDSATTMDQLTACHDIINMNWPDNGKGV